MHLFQITWVLMPHPSTGYYGKHIVSNIVHLLFEKQNNDPELLVSKNENHIVLF